MRGGWSLNRAATLTDNKYNEDTIRENIAFFDISKKRKGFAFFD